jgi:hypothetical protein
LSAGQLKISLKAEISGGRDDPAGMTSVRDSSRRVLTVPPPSARVVSANPGRRAAFYDQLGEKYASTASQCLHTKLSANQDSGTVSGSESMLRTVSWVHVLQETKSERASSQRTAPSVAGGPGGCSGLIHPPRAQCFEAVSPIRSRRPVSVAFPCDRHSG